MAFNRLSCTRDCRASRVLQINSENKHCFFYNTSYSWFDTKQTVTIKTLWEKRALYCNFIAVRRKNDLSFKTKQKWLLDKNINISL